MPSAAAVRAPQLGMSLTGVVDPAGMYCRLQIARSDRWRVRIRQFHRQRSNHRKLVDEAATIVALMPVPVALIHGAKLEQVVAVQHGKIVRRNI